MTVDELITQRETLLKALGSSSLTVRSGDDSITSRPISEILAALRAVDMQIALLSAQPETPPIRQIRIYADKGL